MKVSYHGHSVVKIVVKGKTILIDPFITGNTNCDLDPKTIKVDAILLTHGHNDHVGDTIDLAKRNDALVVGPVELCDYLSSKGVRVHAINLGGGYDFEFGRVKLTKAFHSSSYSDESQNIIYTGMPAGILFYSEGKTIYHAGDTGLFSDMKMIGERNQIDLAFLPIGDNFTMGPDDAVDAAKWVQAKLVVPIHYNTFPVIQQNPQLFVEKLETGVGKVLRPGEELEL